MFCKECSVKQNTREQSQSRAAGDEMWWAGFGLVWWAFACCSFRVSKARTTHRGSAAAVAAELDELAAHGVLARVEQEVAAAGVPQRRDASVVARGLLDPPDVRVRCQSRDGLGQQVDARAPRHVVEDHGQVDGLGDREEVRLERALRRLILERKGAPCFRGSEEPGSTHGGGGASWAFAIDHCDSLHLWNLELGEAGAVELAGALRARFLPLHGVTFYLTQPHPG